MKLKQISPKFYLGIFDFVTLLKLNARTRTTAKMPAKISAKVKSDLKNSERKLEEFNRKRYTLTQEDCQGAFEYFKEQIKLEQGGN